MKKFFAKAQGSVFIFEGDELAHFNVLRCKMGEQILCYGEDGYNYLCEVTEIAKKQAVARVIEKTENTKNPKLNITMFQALVKGEKLDLIVQKLTELGVKELYTFSSEFAIAKANDNKLDRLNKISKEACKQCGRSIPLILHESIAFNKMIELLSNYDIILFANEKNTDRTLSFIKDKKNIAIIVGSEGGFSDGEISAIETAGATSFGLGDRILRAETACIALASIVGYIAGV